MSRLVKDTDSPMWKIRPSTRVRGKRVAAHVGRTSVGTAMENGRVATNAHESSALRYLVAEMIVDKSCLPIDRCDF